MTGEKHNKGFTLVELIVAVGVFTTAMLILTTAFISLGRAQTRQKDVQNLQNDVQNLFETIDREIRTGYGETFTSGTNSLYFRNQDNKCITYWLDGGKISRSENSPDSCSENKTNGKVLTSSNDTFSDLSFVINPSGLRTENNNTVTPSVKVLTAQSSVQLSFKACRGTNCMNVRTSITSRQLAPYVP